MVPEAETNVRLRPRDAIFIRLVACTRDFLKIKNV